MEDNVAGIICPAVELGDAKVRAHAAFHAGIRGEVVHAQGESRVRAFGRA